MAAGRRDGGWRHRVSNCRARHSLTTVEMNDEQIERAAAALAAAWRDDAHFGAMPEGCAPATLADGYAVQSRLAKLVGTPQSGWKIAATSAGGQRHIGVEHPLIGRLFADRVYPAPATLMMRDNRMRVAEAEFCFRFGRDLPAGVTDLTAEAVMEYVDALFPAIEVPDSRFVDFVSVGAPALVADNACAREFVLGEPVAGDWRDIAFDRFPVVVYLDGERAVEGVGADVLGDPRDALAWMANECARRDMTLKSGHLVTTGVLGRPLAIAPGNRVRADFGVLGEVELSLSGEPGA